MWHAGDKDVALVETSPVTLGSDGVLNIVLAATKDQATLAALEITIPALFRINSGSSKAFTDAVGHQWLADYAYIGESSYIYQGASCQVIPLHQRYMKGLVHHYH